MLVSFTALLIYATPANGGPFSPKTMQEKGKHAYIDRDFNLPKGVHEIAFEAASKVSTAVRDQDGQLAFHDEGVLWSHSQFWLNYAHGFSRQTTMYMKIPFVLAHLQTQDDHAISTFALGDVRSGILYQPQWRPFLDLAFKLELKSPSGLEWPGSGRNSADIQSFLTGTGITNLGAHLMLQKQWNAFVMTRLEGAYVFKKSAVVGYVVEEEGYGNGRLDPGDEFYAKADLWLQPTKKLALSGFGDISYRLPTLMGATGEDNSWSNAEMIIDTALYVNVGGTIMWSPNAQFDLIAGAAIQTIGSDTRRFAALGLEEFTPQPGWTGSLSGRLRW